MKEASGSLIGFALLAYFIISQLMTVVFFIDICKKWDVLWEIIILGPFVSEFKGLLWPFFI